MTLNQLGVGPSGGFFITDKTDLWSDFALPTDNVEGMKVYMYIKVRLVFDPPSNAFVVDALERQAKEYEWRLNVQADKPVEVPVT